MCPLEGVLRLGDSKIHDQALTSLSSKSHNNSIKQKQIKAKGKNAPGG